MKLNPPGMSILLDVAPATSAKQLTDSFLKETRLKEVARTVGQSIRSALTASVKATCISRPRRSMMSRSKIEGRLVDAQGNLIGLVRVSMVDGLWSGKIDLTNSAPGIVSLFTQFEELVNGQMLPLVDDLEAEISQLGARLLVAEGEALPVGDLQIYPVQREVSFRTT
ncbi:hypothetical protein ACLESD_10090 [Pyxidicoccus sp. 3LFB2]